MTSIFSMRGLLTLKVRSTPTPDAMRRTVIDRVIPPPRRRMTVPSKTWMRSRLPSTTLSDTFTVSPVASSGRSVRSWSWTISSSTVTGRFLTHLGSRGCDSVFGRDADGRRRRSIARPRGRSVAGVEVGSASAGALDRLLASPARHGDVVARGEDGRHAFAAEDRRSRVLRVFEEAVGEGFLDRRRGLDGARQEADDRIDDDQRRQLPAREDIVADRQLDIDQGADPFVDTLVARTEEDEMRSRREVGSTRLAEDLA